TSSIAVYTKIHTCPSYPYSSHTMLPLLKGRKNMRSNIIPLAQCHAEEAGTAAEVAYQNLREDLASALDLRNYYIREIQEAEATLAHITARVQKRRATLVKFEVSILELRTKAHVLGIDRDLGKT